MRYLLIALIVVLSFAADLPTKDERQATFKLETQGTPKMLVKGEKIWTNSSYTFLFVPEELDGAKFIQNQGKHQSKIMFSVLRDGYLVVLFPNSGGHKFKWLEENGWLPIELEKQVEDNCDTGGWVAYRKDFKRGDTVTLSVHKYHAPIILLLR